MKHIITMAIVTPAKAAGQGQPLPPRRPWIPAFAGMTNGLLKLRHSLRIRA
jgi:hypothetical protein